MIYFFVILPYILSLHLSIILALLLTIIIVYLPLIGILKRINWIYRILHLILYHLLRSRPEIFSYLLFFHSFFCVRCFLLDNCWLLSWFELWVPLRFVRIDLILVLPNLRIYPLLLLLLPNALLIIFWLISIHMNVLLILLIIVAIVLLIAFFVLLGAGLLEWLLLCNLFIWGMWTLSISISYFLAIALFSMGLSSALWLWNKCTLVVALGCSNGIHGVQTVCRQRDIKHILLLAILFLILWGRFSWGWHFGIKVFRVGGCFLSGWVLGVLSWNLGFWVRLVLFFLYLWAILRRLWWFSNITLQITLFIFLFVFISY